MLWQIVKLLIALKEKPLSAQLVDKGVTGIEESWKQDKLRVVGIRRTAVLVGVAKANLGIRQGITAAMNDFGTSFDKYEQKILLY